MHHSTRAMIQRMQKGGYTLRQIVKDTGLDLKTIQIALGEKERQRKRRKKKTLKEIEEAAILELLREGHSIQDIGKHFDINVLGPKHRGLLAVDSDEIP